MGYEMVFPMLLPVLLLCAIAGGLLGAAAVLGYLAFRNLWAEPLARREVRALAARASVVGACVGVALAAVLVGFNFALHFI